MEEEGTRGNKRQFFGDDPPCVKQQRPWLFEVRCDGGTRITRKRGVRLGQKKKRLVSCRGSRSRRRRRCQLSLSRQWVEVLPNLFHRSRGWRRAVDIWWGLLSVFFLFSFWVRARVA